MRVVNYFSPYVSKRSTKLLRILKLTFLLLTVFSLAVNARSGSSQNISITVKNATLEKIFGEIEKQTGYYFVYRADLLIETKPVSLDVKDAGLCTVLDLCFEEQPINYTIIEKNVVISKKSGKAGCFITGPPRDWEFGMEKAVAILFDGSSSALKPTNSLTTTNKSGEFCFKKMEVSSTLVIKNTILRVHSTLYRSTGRVEYAFIYTRPGIRNITSFAGIRRKQPFPQATVKMCIYTVCNRPENERVGSLI